MYLSFGSSVAWVIGVIIFLIGLVDFGFFKSTIFGVMQINTLIIVGVGVLCLASHYALGELLARINGQGNTKEGEG